MRRNNSRVGRRMIVLIVGDFGVGKDTFADILVDAFNEHYTSLVAKKILSYTTRYPRYSKENTHIFTTMGTYWEDVRNNEILAETEIGDVKYWTTKNQFGSLPYDVYVVDDIGVKCVLDAKIDNVFIIEITRPKELINLPKSRLERERTMFFKYEPHFTIENDGTIQDLKWAAEQIVFLLPFFKIYE